METQKTTTVINNLTKDVQTISNNTPPPETLIVGVLVRNISLVSIRSSTICIMSYLARYFNIELYFFTTADFNPTDKTVSATLIDGNNRIEKIIPLPKIVYNDYECFVDEPRQEIKSLLIKECYFFRRGILKTNNGRSINKQVIYDILLKDGRFKEFLIETHTVESFDQFLSLFEKYNNDVVLKPTNGMTGHDVSRVTLNRGCDYLLTCKDGKTFFEDYR